MKKNLFICLSLAAMLSGCTTEEEVSRSDFKALSFETFVGRGTRAVPKSAFSDGDDFGIFAYRHGTDSWSADVTKTLFMDNVKVSMQGGAWTYSPTKYWEEGVNHTFLAYSPYNENYLINGEELWGITTATKASEQKDLLYTIPEAGAGKDLVWKDAGTKVVMTFRHALSQIRISASTDQDYSGYYIATIRKVQLKGIGNTGNLNLNTADAAQSPWSRQGSTIPAESGIYTVETETLNIPLTTEESLLNGENNLFMQIPQEIANDETATFEITYDIEATEAGNVSNAATGKKAVIKIPSVTWEHNHIYHYKIQMDLQQLLNLKPVLVAEPEVVEWEAGGETKLPEDLTVTINPTSDGDTPQKGKGNATLGITKSSTAGGTQTVRIENPEKEDQWIVEVGPEITETVTRADTKTPADWLKVCKAGENVEVSKLYGKEDADIQIKITQTNTTGSARQAEVTIRRALSGVTRIMVTQEKAPAATIETNSTQFAMEGGKNQLTIINPSSETWTLSKSEGSDWLSLVDENGASVTTGTNEQIVKAVATANTTPDMRKAVITLTRAGQDDVTVEVTQEAPRPMSISSSAVALPYLKTTFTQTVTNPEAGKEGFGWTLEGGEDAAGWLTVSSRKGTGAVTDKIIFTATMNTSTTANRGSVYFTFKRAGQKDIRFSIGQRAAPVTTLSASAISAAYSAGTYTFNVASPDGISWNLGSSHSWMTLTPVSGNGNAKVNVSVQENKSYLSARTGTVTLTREGQTPVTLTLTQSKGPVPKTTVTPVIYQEKPSAAMNSKVYHFTITALVGKKWTAEIVGNPYGFYKYMSFSKTNNSVYKLERMSTGTISVYMHDVTNITTGIGLIYIYPEGEDRIEAGFIISNR